MYPFFEIYSGVFIHTFGITLSVCFFFFLWNLSRLAKRFGYSFSFFTQNIVWLFLSTFLFARIFYVIGRWQDMKFINNPLQFFVSSEYNFSLFGAIFGFLLCLYLLVRVEKSSMGRYIDGVVLSFFFILVIGYIGALFGGQVYGRETMLGIEIAYTNAYSLVPYQVPVFPLPIVYAFVSFFIFCALYICSLFIHVKGFIGYLGVILFAAMILIFESFSGKQDILSVRSIFNLPQVFALFTAVWGAYNFSKIFKEKNSHETVQDIS